MLGTSGLEGPLANMTIEVKEEMVIEGEEGEEMEEEEGEEVGEELKTANLGEEIEETETIRSQYTRTNKLESIAITVRNSKKE